MVRWTLNFVAGWLPGRRAGTQMSCCASDRGRPRSALRSAKVGPSAERTLTVLALFKLIAECRPSMDEYVH